MRPSRRWSSFPLVAGTLLALAACDSPSSSPTALDHLSAHETHGATTALAAHGDLFKAVRQSTSPFNASSKALAAGYASDPHCVAHPVLGGMGMHWVNGALIDPTFDALQPEALLYAPRAGNRPKLVGVEYIVIDVGQPRPHFGDHPFDIGGVPPLMAAGVPHWSLHVWVHQVNPAGVFTPFNPNVRCD
jgi:hypothetical protein